MAAEVSIFVRNIRYYEAETGMGSSHGAHHHQGCGDSTLILLNQSLVRSAAIN